MAYQIPNPNSTNTAPFSPGGNQPSIAISFGFPFSGQAIFNSVYSYQAAIKSTIINWFLTNLGERIMNPNFGANLRAYIFEAVDSNTFEVLEMKIKDDLKNYFPMVTLQDLKVLGETEYNKIKIELYYYVSDINSVDNVTLTFQ